MKLSHIISVAISIAFIPLADLLLVGAALPLSPPNEAYIRFYERPNCQNAFHETGFKDFQRLTCGPKLDTSSCVSGNFLSYRLEMHPGPDETLPKLDQLWVKTNSTTCDMNSDIPGDVRAFSPHPYSNPGFLSSGCHLFNPSNQLAINPRHEISYSYWCTWGSFTPGQQQVGPPTSPSPPVQPQLPMINPVAPAQQQPPPPMINPVASTQQQSPPPLPAQQQPLPPLPSP